MLWPTDEGMREEILGVLRVELMLLSGNYPQPTTTAERQEYFDLIRNAPQLEPYSKQLKEAYRCGMIAGALLREVVIGIEFGRPVTLTTSKRRIARNFVADRISTSTIDNSIWKHYRGVAAYWAALVDVSPEFPPPLAPCRPADLGRFLATADRWRQRGEAARATPKSPPLLRKGETIAVF